MDLPVDLHRQVQATARDTRRSLSETVADLMRRGVIGHRQVTDAYLAHLARTRQGRLATFDRGLAESHRDVTELVPTG